MWVYSILYTAKDTAILQLNTLILSIVMVEWSKVKKTTVDKEVHLYSPEERHALFSWVTVIMCFFFASLFSPLHKKVMRWLIFFQFYCEFKASIPDLNVL